MNYPIESPIAKRPLTLFFNSTPVIVVDGMPQKKLGGVWCTLVEWPNGDRNWQGDDDLRLAPKEAI